ncbi:MULTISPECIES: hypothetical protein [Yersinia]|uniref:Uncharacterized protein n=2 Tax=Yersinia bercovieri TaxID=634 RepID=A0A2G4TY03_YERBE|nr:MULTISPECIES: hypothetical protein [Yersinia]PHZ25941.1 hypothetical protein CS533_18970 [Yersinia bercovieri]QDW34109.1 hypothetical protein FFE93_014260 [Yersinia sp. KBS0713]QKJ07688.1 hypothetical protein HRK25_12800 [Yersinia bercovieri ATCC 43970]
MCHQSNGNGLLIYNLYLAIILLMLSTLSYADNRPGFVCGKFNGHVMEVPQSYIIYWAEYEGASAWDPDFINNKKGCDANFVVLPMITSWPDMQPGDKSNWYKEKRGFNGLTISVEPLKRPDSDITYRRDFYLKKRKDKTFDPVIYRDDLGLFFVKATQKLIRSKSQDENDPYWFDEDINGYYWQEIDGRIPVIFDCIWLPLEKRDYICEAHFVMSEIGSLVEVSFTPEKLKQWKEIVSRTQQFLLAHIKH